MHWRKISKPYCEMSPILSSPFASSSMHTLDDPIMEHMAAGAFVELCEHLRLRSDVVQNIDLMTVGGFCRNCLAKVRSWFHISRWRTVFHTNSRITLGNRNYFHPRRWFFSFSAQWMVFEARKLSGDLLADRFSASTFTGSEEGRAQTIDKLNSFGYEESAKQVYGCTFFEWKERHQKKATEEQA